MYVFQSNNNGLYENKVGWFHYDSDILWFQAKPESI